MSQCQIHHMDVIPYAGSIRSIVIISEYAQALQFSDGHLRHIGKQVVGNTLGIFTDHAAFMSSDGIKVTEQDHVPLRICRMQVGKDLLQHPLGPSIRIRTGSFGALLCDRHESRIPVYGSGRAEDDILYPMVSHGVTQIQCTGNVVFIVLDGFYYRLAHRLQTGKMNHRVHRLFIKNIIHRGFVADVCIVEG